MATYTRQSSFSNGDVIDAPLLNNEYDALVLAFDPANGHKHDGAEAPYVSLIAEPTGESGIIVDDTIPEQHKIRFDIAGVTFLEWDQLTPDVLLTTPKISHDGGPLDVFLDDLVIAVGDAASDAAAAAASAEAAENAAMVVGVPVLVADAATYVISEDAEVADVIFLGDGTLTLPTLLEVGRRFYVHVHLSAVGKTVQIPTGAHTITGNKNSIPPANTLELIEGDVVVLEVVSTTELEIL